WQYIGGAWYYLMSSGAMAANTWVGNFYVNGSGVWIP
ncbi:MAG: cell surface protein, partial [Lachnospiraceae bacterium]